LHFCFAQCAVVIILHCKYIKKKRCASFLGYFFDKSVKCFRFAVFGVVKMGAFGAIAKIWGSQNEAIRGNT
jgi:hypothetical protein